MRRLPDTVWLFCVLLAIAACSRSPDAIDWNSMRYEQKTADAQAPCDSHSGDACGGPKRTLLNHGVGMLNR